MHLGEARRVQEILRQGRFGVVRRGAEGFAEKRYETGTSLEKGLCSSVVREGLILETMAPHDAVVTGEVFWKTAGAASPRGSAVLRMPMAQGDLDSFLTGRWEKPESGQVASWFDALRRAVRHIHFHGVLHRDIKPGNMLLYEGSNVRLTDFGSAAVLLEGMPPLEHDVTTFQYASPEMLRRLPYHCPHDYWSLAVSFAELLLGGHLFLGDGNEREAVDNDDKIMAVQRGHRLYLDSVREILPQQWKRYLYECPEVRCSEEEAQGGEWCFQCIEDNDGDNESVGAAAAGAGGLCTFLPDAVLRAATWLQRRADADGVSDPARRFALSLVLRAAPILLRDEGDDQQEKKSLCPVLFRRERDDGARRLAAAALSCSCKFLEHFDPDLRYAMGSTLLREEEDLLSALLLPASRTVFATSPLSTLVYASESGRKRSRGVW